MSRFLTLAEIMSVEMVTVSRETPIGEIAALMRDRAVGSVLVIDEGAPVGIVTERDLVAAMAARRDCATTRVADVMTMSLVVADPESDIVYAARTMAARGIRHLPVAKDGTVVGMVSIRDIVRWGLMALAVDPSGDDARVAFRALGVPGFGE